MGDDVRIEDGAGGGYDFGGYAGRNPADHFYRHLKSLLWFKCNQGGATKKSGCYAAFASEELEDGRLLAMLQ